MRRVLVAVMCQNTVVCAVRLQAYLNMHHTREARTDHRPSRILSGICRITRLANKLEMTQEQRKAHEAMLAVLERDQAVSSSQVNELNVAVPALQAEVEKLQFLLAGIEELTV